MVNFRFSLLFLVALSFVSIGSAQPMQYSLNNAPGEYGGTVLTTGAGSSTPIPDGEGTVYVYQDADANGPSANDLLVPLCTHPDNDCWDGPIGTFNFNSFLMNGEEMVGQAGYFASPVYLTSVGNMPVGAARFYVKVKYPSVNPCIEWLSEVKTATPGGSGDWFFTEWSISSLITYCNPSADIYFNPNPSVGPQNQTACIMLCDPHVETIFVGPLPQPDRIPHVYVTLGCSGITYTCYGGPALGVVFDPNAWNWYTSPSGDHYYRNTIILDPSIPGNFAGYVTLNFDYILPVEMGEFTAMPGDNSVLIRWNTLSESNLARFEILRDGNRIGARPAVNSATGARYDYTDHSAVNGTTYYYSLVAVNMDGATETVGNATATPSASTVSEFALYQNYPNPFNPTTTISFDLAETGKVSLKVFNLMGQPIAELVKGSLSAGHHDVAFDANLLPSGVYVYQLKAGNYSATRKMLLMK